MRCKYCKDKFEKLHFLQKWCLKPECIKKAKDDHWKKVTKPKLKKELLSVQDYIKIAQKVFNDYIRERDKGNNCISCGKPPKKENAGHWMNANNHWAVRFDENNVHLQCEHCNTYLSGNLLNYTPNLIKKIGQKNYDELVEKAKTTRKYTIDELKQIIETYKEKKKQLVLKTK
jgi:hypothetical protein